MVECEPPFEESERFARDIIRPYRARSPERHAAVV
jgi:hypothetical protein